MKKHIVWHSLLALIALYMPMAEAGVTIHFEPGPYGGERIMTPWGDYIAVQEGSTIWVGTETEYDHARVAAIARSHGEREFSTEAGQTFIDAGLPSVSVGKNELASIDTEILFGVQPDRKLRRPKKPRDAEYVSMVWVQSANGVTRATILDRVDRKTYSPHDCGADRESGFHYCEAIVPRAALTHNVAIVFTQPGQRPGFLPAESLAKLQYTSIRQHVQSLKGYGIPISADDPDDSTFHDLKMLHAIDPDIPDTIQ